MKILLADDSVTAQNMGKKILTEAGHEVLTVNNGAAALKKVTEQEPDLVILDIYMPGYSGLEVCQQMKEARHSANIPVLLTVGKLEPFRKEDAKRVRAEALLVKPFEASELIAAVSRFAEMVAGKPPKAAKPKSKASPEPKPPQEEPSEEEFVTASQKAGATEEAETVAPESKGPVDETDGERFGIQGEEPERSLESGEQPAGHAEFEVAAPSVTGAEETSIKAEGDSTMSSGDEPPAAKAAAAAAGAEFGGKPQPGEFTITSPLSQAFAAAAPSEPKAGETSGLSASSRGELQTFQSTPEMSAASTLDSAPASQATVPSIDPAFDPDRTRWATEFATRFGTKEAQPPEETETEPAAADDQLGTTPASAPEEISAVLANLPGSFSAEAPPADEEKSEASQAWPAESGTAISPAWEAEEVPAEGQEFSVSLADEMEQAAMAATTPPQSSPQAPEAEPGPAPSDDHASQFDTPAGAVQAQSSGDYDAADEQMARPVAVPSDSEAPAISKADEAPVSLPPDHVTGVMQSAAMAIATQAAISAVKSELHDRDKGDAAIGASAIEDLVSKVLDRLKPKLVAEITRELDKPEEK